MTDDDLIRLLRSQLRPTADAEPSRDLWPVVVGRGAGQARWPWLDVGVAAAVVTVLLMFPDWAFFLAFHL